MNRSVIEDDRARTLSSVATRVVLACAKKIRYFVKRERAREGRVGRGVRIL